MKKRSIIGIVVAAVVYLLLFILGAASGAIHTACFAYAGTVMPLFFAFVYLYTASNMKCFGAAAVLNGFVLIVSLLAGEGNTALIVIMLVMTALAEIIRAVLGYDNLKGVMWSFIPFAFSFYAYTFHWWTETAGSLEEAVEEMPAGYAATMEAVINNTPAIVIALVLVIPAAVLGMTLAKKLMKGTSSRLQAA